MYFLQIIVTAVFLDVAKTSYCGCKTMRLCYQKMLDELRLENEDHCVENVAIGSSTVTVFLKAIKTYCGNVVKVYDNFTTSEGRYLYEVVINWRPSSEANDPIPTIVLEAGQDAGVEPVGFALYVIEQLVGCIQNKPMLRNVRWVILPSTNPDGLECSRNTKMYWSKNKNRLQKMALGVDITRNFDDSWSICPNNNNLFSNTYPGYKANSENETKFIIDVLRKYKNDINTYVSLRRDGHGIFYPFAGRNITFASVEDVKKRASDIAAKINQRAGGFHWFINGSIFNMNGKAHCGHSVDYAISKLSIPYSYEMRIFSETVNNVISMFQNLPKGHEVTLRNGYFSGIREIYNLIINEMKQKKQPK